MALSSRLAFFRCRRHQAARKRKRHSTGWTRGIRHGLLGVPRSGPPLADRAPSNVSVRPSHGGPNSEETDVSAVKGDPVVLPAGPHPLADGFPQTGLQTPQDLGLRLGGGSASAALVMEDPPASTAPRPWSVRLGAVHASIRTPCPSAGSQSDPELTSCVRHPVSSRNRVRHLCHYVPRTPLVRRWYRAVGSLPRAPGEMGGRECGAHERNRTCCLCCKTPWRARSPRRHQGRSS